MKTPDTNPKTAQGMMKCPVQLVPAQAIREEAEAMRHGAEKYYILSSVRSKQISIFRKIQLEVH